MKKIYIGLLILLISSVNMHCYAVEPSESYTTSEEIIELQENEPTSALHSYDENIAFYGEAGSTYRFEVFFDRTFPDIFFCIQNDTGIQYQAKDMDEDIDGTSIEIRTVETISGQNFSVIYFTCGIEGTYTIEYSKSDCSTFVLAETHIKENYKSNIREQRLPVIKTFYDIIGPYTEVDLDTLLDPDYNPLDQDANNLIKDKVIDYNIYIPINFFTVSFTLTIIASLIFYFVRKHLIKLKAIEENIIHTELINSINSSQIAAEEQNEELKEYWDIIKNDYVD